MTYDYFYGQQADQFSFYRIPKALFTDEAFDSISIEAKLLYGILLDRMNLSAKNGWLPQLTAILCEGGQLVYDEAQPAPLDEGNQHVNPVAGHDLLFKLRVHLRLMDCASEQAGLCNRGLRANNLRLFIHGPDAVLPVKKRKKLLRPLRNRERIEVSFFCFSLDRGDDLVGQRDLRIQIPAIITEIVQPALDHLGHILCQHLGRLCSINGRSLTKLVRSDKLSVKAFVDDLLV